MRKCVLNFWVDLDSNMKCHQWEYPLRIPRVFIFQLLTRIFLQVLTMRCSQPHSETPRRVRHHSWATRVGKSCSETVHSPGRAYFWAFSLDGIWAIWILAHECLRNLWTQINGSSQVPSHDFNQHPGSLAAQIWSPPRILEMVMLLPTRCSFHKHSNFPLHSLKPTLFFSPSPLGRSRGVFFALSCFAWIRPQLGKGNTRSTHEKCTFGKNPELFA